MLNHRVFCFSAGLVIAAFLPACNSCDDPTCYNSGFSVAFVNQDGKGVNRGTFEISAVADTTRLDASCTFNKEGDTCPLVRAEDSEGTVSAEAKAIGSSIVVNFSKVEDNNIIGPELVSIKVNRDSKTVGSLTRTPIYEKELPNGKDCAYCTHASEPLEIDG